MAEVERFDAIVIGAGQSGGPLSSALARSGKKTAIIEREHVGGTCINVGCTPTKTMVASARVAYLAGRAGDYGVRVSPPAVDMVRVRERKRDMVESFRASSERHIVEAEGTELIYGEATFTGHKELEVALRGGGKRALSSGLIFINTGARPTTPQLDGLDSVPWYNSTTIMELDAVPGHLIVLGGGYVGLEFAQMFRRFGSRVTVVHHGRHLLSPEDPDVAEAVADVLREDGLTLMLESEAVRIAPGEGEGIAVTVRGPAGRQEMVGSHLLAALGRTPNTNVLKPEVTGVEMDRDGHINVNDRLETNVEGIYALGDVNGGPAFTHISYDDWRIVRTNLLEGGSASTKDRLVPYVVFIDPELGRVGMTEREAQEQGRKVKVFKMPVSYISRTNEVDEMRGMMKALVDEESGQILGCAALGLQGGELMSMLSIAMMGKVPYTVLKEAIFAHPTLAEGLNTLFSQ